jgi:hypothetical protein
VNPGIPPDQSICAAVAAMGSELDVDGNGQVDLATDVVYLARYLLNLLPVPPSFRRTNPTIPPDSVIAANIAALCPIATCGNGVLDPGEQCDDGGICIGGANAGTQCTADSQCHGEGVCLAGSKVLTACSTDVDCPGSRCIRCKPFGGDGCAPNCTTETDILASLVRGVVTGTDILPGTSGAVVHGEILTIPLPLTGTEILTVGAQANGGTPLVIRAASVHFPAIPVSTIACACVRAVPAKTCGGTLFDADGSESTDCTPEFTVGDGACVGKKPCAFVHGPGNSASGSISCDGGLSGLNYLVTQDSGGSTGQAGAPVIQFSGVGGAGSALVMSTTAIGTVVGACTGTDPAYGSDGQFCTNDEPQSSRGTPWTAPSTTGTACARIDNANATDENTIGPFCISGRAFSCTDLANGSVAGAALASAFAVLNQPTVGDIVVTSLEVFQ